jgi:hypothetical protein
MCSSRVEIHQIEPQPGSTGVEDRAEPRRARGDDLRGDACLKGVELGIAAAGRGQPTNGLMYFRSGCTGNAVNHNIWSGNGADVAVDSAGGTSYPTGNTQDYDCVHPGSVPSSLTANGNTLGSHMVSSDPKFVNPSESDFRLQSGSPAAGLGAYG